jgi:hypothetical protein
VKNLVKDINGVEYSYANKDELAFGTYYEDEIIVESEPEVEIIQLVPRMYAKKLPKEVAQRTRAIDGFGE